MNERWLSGDPWLPASTPYASALRWREPERIWGMSKLAKVVYRPFGLSAGIVSASIAGAIFKQIWKKVAGADDAPSALQSEYRLRELVLAALIQGAIFAVVKVLVDRGGARAFQKVTGEWPGD